MSKRTEANLVWSPARASWTFLRERAAASPAAAARS